MRINIQNKDFFNSLKKHNKEVGELLIGIEAPWGSSYTTFEIAYSFLNQQKELWKI